jgi:hypothetical protein
MCSGMLAPSLRQNVCLTVRLVIYLALHVDPFAPVLDVKTP